MNINNNTTYRQSNQNRNKDGANRIRNHPTKQVHENSADNNSYRSKGVRQDVKKHSLKMNS